VIGSVTGQNVYSAQYAAYRRPPVQANDQDGGWGSTNGASGSLGTGGPRGIGGGIQPTLSEGMNFALLASDATGSPSQAGGQGSVTSATAQTASGRRSDLSSLLLDLQSLLSFLSGTTTSGTTIGGTGATAGSGGSSSAGHAGTTDTTDAASRLMQDLQALASCRDAPGSASTDVASLESGQHSAPAERRPEPLPWNNDVVNTGTTTADAGSGSTAVLGTRTNAWQQFMLSTYASGTDRTASSSSAGVAV
jgi:hypothetical protein